MLTPSWRHLPITEQRIVQDYTAGLCDVMGWPSYGRTWDEIVRFVCSQKDGSPLLALFLERMELGLRRYGGWEKNTPLSMPKEAGEELADAPAYLTFEKLYRPGSHARQEALERLRNRVITCQLDLLGLPK